MPENTAKPDLAEPVDPISRGWLGCYDGFTVKSAHSVSLDGHGAGLPSETVLSSKDGRKEVTHVAVSISEGVYAQFNEPAWGNAVLSFPYMCIELIW